MRKIEKIFLDSAGLCSQLCEVVGIFPLARYINRNKVIILMYHGITAKHDPVVNFDGKHVEVTLFEKQLEHLKEKYSIISLSDFIAAREGKKLLPKNSVLLTFDDGYKNMYTQLFSVLKNKQTPITIFLPTGYIGKNVMGWYDAITAAIAGTKEKEVIIAGKKYVLEKEKQKCAAILELKIKASENPNIKKQLIAEVFAKTKFSKKIAVTEDFSYLTWEECKEMQKATVTFGSHSVTHPFLTKEQNKEGEKELSDSKEFIEKKLGQECVAFAYPFGDYNAAIAQQTKNAGYLLAVTTTYGKNVLNTNPYKLKRIAISNMYNAKIFPLLLITNFGKFHHSIIVAYSKIRQLF